ncbi:MAG: hypothetical protein QW328_07285 [Nitrososphaerota archaeon]
MRIPIPLIFAAVMALTSVTLVFKVVVMVIGSYDTTYAAFNGTHVVSHSLPSTAYVYVYGGGGGRATYTSDTTTYHYQCFGSACTTEKDFGAYIPVLITVNSGNYPFGSIIEVNQPYGYTTYKVRVVLYNDGNGWVAGQSSTGLGAGQVGYSIPVRWYQSSDGRQIWIYPIDRGRISRALSEGCSVAGLGGAVYRFVVSIQTVERYDCTYASWGSTTFKFSTLASATTTATWSIGWITQRVSGSGYDITIHYAPLIFISPATHFAVRPQ